MSIYWKKDLLCTCPCDTEISVKRPNNHKMPLNTEDLFIHSPICYSVESSLSFNSISMANNCRLQYISKIVGYNFSLSLHCSRKITKITSYFIIKKSYYIKTNYKLLSNDCASRYKSFF